jgi:hypothetical protein
LFTHVGQTTYNKSKALDVCKGNTTIGLISIVVNNITFIERGTYAKKGTPIKQKAPIATKGTPIKEKLATKVILKTPFKQKAQVSLSNLGKVKTPQATNSTRSKEIMLEAPQVVKRTPIKETMSLDVVNKAPQALKGKEKVAHKSNGDSPRRKLVIQGPIDDIFPPPIYYSKKYIPKLFPQTNNMFNPSEGDFFLKLQINFKEELECV